MSNSSAVTIVSTPRAVATILQNFFSAMANGIGGRADRGCLLDLNIGLSWVPMKVKQEAVMSSSCGREKREWEKEE